MSVQGWNTGAKPQIQSFPRNSSINMFSPGPVGEDYSSKLYAAGKSAAVLKESHFELAQSYRTALRNERRLRKTVGSMKDEIDALKAQLGTVWTKVSSRPVEAWSDVLGGGGQGPILQRDPRNNTVWPDAALLPAVCLFGMLF